MTTEPNMRQVELWFAYLKLADRLGLVVDWKFYKPWGSRRELREWKFARWWKERGSRLFEESVDRRLLVDVPGDGYVHVKVPVHWTVRRARKEIGPAIKPHLSRKEAEGVREFRMAGRYREHDLKTYLRIVTERIDLLKRGAPAAASDVLDAFLSKQERRIGLVARFEKGKRDKAEQSKRKVRRRQKPIVIGRKATPRNVGLWLKQGSKIAENVAKGEFPGGGRYKVYKAKGRDAAQPPLEIG